MYSVTSNAVARKVANIEEQVASSVIYIGNAQGMTLAQIFNTYATQNTKMYKGFLDWQDNRCPLYGENPDTVEITCYDWNLVAQSIKGKFYTYSNGGWIAAQ